MRRLLLFTGFILSATLALRADDQPTTSQLDPAALVGKWGYEAGAKAGEELSDVQRAGEVEITRESITLLSPDGKFVMTYQLDNTVSPAKIDMTMTESPFGAGAKTKGLIELKDGKVILAYVPSENGAEYPKELVSTSANGLHLFRLKRLPALDPAAIVGKWGFEAGTKAGAAVPPERLAGEVVITRETITLTSPESKFVFAYTLDAQVTPAKLDMTVTESPFGPGAKTKGRIELQDGRLILAYVPQGDGADYPAQLVSTADNKLHLFRLKKVQ